MNRLILSLSYPFLTFPAVRDSGSWVTAYALFRPMLFAFDAEQAHELSLAALSLSPFRAPPAADPVLATQLAGLALPNPVGLAAGYDKNASAADALLGLGFGFVEAGTLTPLAQRGNPKPRLFRLSEDRAVINRMGFNNAGQGDALRRLSARKRQGVVGINIGANKDAANRVADYAQGVRAMAPVADYLTINISSPNTPGLRALQGGDALDELLAAVSEARLAGGPPIFLKVAPDLEPAEINAIAKAAAGRVDALIVSNTTLQRPSLASRHAGEVGGLSGAPLRDLAQQRLSDFRAATSGTIPLIGVGGIATAQDAYARIRAGASAVQLYSALVYEGPGLARRIAQGVKALLLRDGFNNVAEAVGIDAR